ncbi:MAG: penicillin-binding protein 2, partial [Eubacterium sp.]|nr:penicillin-binding protein 2 [Eubacterium sp.]
MANNKNNRRLTEQLRGKLMITYLVIICLFLILVGRIVIWNIIEGKAYTTTVLGTQTNSSSDIPYERGRIYDRNGNILAGNEKLYTLILEPKNIFSDTDSEKQEKWLEATVQAVCEFFGVEEYE